MDPELSAVVLTQECAVLDSDHCDSQPITGGTGAPHDGGSHEHSCDGGDAHSTIAQCGVSPSADATVLRMLCTQMEFYFGNANLSKDRFLSKLLQSDRHGKGWVPLHVFLRFNKIKSLTTDLHLIARAVEMSTTLELSESRRLVRRIDPLPSNSDADSRTIYVDRLPDEVSHESVRGLFSAYGEVLYTSVPRFPLTRIAKGFAFVEFDTPENAEAAIRDFSAHGTKNAMGIRVMSKLLWLLFKEEYKKLLKEARQMGHHVEEKEEEEYIRGVLLRVGNIPKDTPRKSIRDLFESLASVAYVDVSGDGVSSIIRMHQSEGAESVLERHRHEPLLLMQTPLDVSLITGTDERQYWRNVRQLQEAKKEAKKDKKKAAPQPESSTQPQHESPNPLKRLPPNPKAQVAASAAKRTETDAKQPPEPRAPTKKESLQKAAHAPPTKRAKNTHIRFSDGEEDDAHAAMDFAIQPSMPPSQACDNAVATGHQEAAAESHDGMQMQQTSDAKALSSDSHSMSDSLEDDGLQ